jgi:hypothetical protein|tara:strand:+ start:56 stop:370 length:315 start_codon:yes stop_codon:yes gene_type:complete
MIKQTTVLNDLDWKNLHGNDVFVTMLRNKISLSNEIPIDANFQESEVRSAVLEYINTTPQDLVYYNIEHVHSHINIDVYFYNAVEMENFLHYYKTMVSLNEIQK